MIDEEINLDIINIETNVLSGLNVESSITTGINVSEVGIGGPKGEKGDPGEPASDYVPLVNKPKINDVTLQGNKTFEDLGAESLSNIDIENIINSIV